VDTEQFLGQSEGCAAFLAALFGGAALLAEKALHEPVALPIDQKIEFDLRRRTAALPPRPQVFHGRGAVALE
jgi:hypothetical protein